MEVVAAIDWLVFGDNNQGGWCQAHSGSTSEKLIALSCWPLVFLCRWTMADWTGHSVFQGQPQIGRRDSVEAGEKAAKIQRNKKRTMRNEGNRSSLTVIFACEFWQQYSKDNVALQQRVYTAMHSEYSTPRSCCALKRGGKKMRLAFIYFEAIFLTEIRVSKLVLNLKHNKVLCLVWIVGLLFTFSFIVLVLTFSFAHLHVEWDRGHLTATS